VREIVLEELRAGEVLEIRVIDPSLADLLIGQREDVLEQQQPDHEPGGAGGPALVAEHGRNLGIEPLPVDRAGELHQLVFHVDDLIESGPEQIAFARRLRLLWSHRSLRCDHTITTDDSRESQK
jgi:hypothetical protein